MDLREATKQIKMITAHLRKLGCTSEQIRRHVTPLRRKYGLNQPRIRFKQSTKSMVNGHRSHRYVPSWK
jgi:hypothetical protein